MRAKEASAAPRGLDAEAEVSTEENAVLTSSPARCKLYESITFIGTNMNPYAFRIRIVARLLGLCLVVDTSGGPGSFFVSG
jgi:hypothetical protein